MLLLKVLPYLPLLSELFLMHKVHLSLEVFIELPLDLRLLVKTSLFRILLELSVVLEYGVVNLSIYL